MSDIFISYKREEQTAARKLADALQKKGWSVWWDPKLRAGEHFDEAIEKALNDAKCVIVMWSKLSVNSRYVKDEANYALNRNKLVPITIEEVDLPFRFVGIQAGQLIDWDGSESFPGYQKLVADIGSILGPPPVEVGDAVQKEAAKHKEEKELKRIDSEVEGKHKETGAIIADERPPITSLKSPYQKRLITGIFATALIIVLSIIGWFLINKLGLITTSKPESFTNSIGMNFVLIPAGKFDMGSPSNEQTRDKDERQHEVNISKPFYLQTTEVTQGQWIKITGKNPSEFKNCGDDCPVERVSWDMAQKFVNELNQRESTIKYHLPTEAEWEYACRAETKTAFSFGNDVNKLGEFAWYQDNSKGQTHPVGTKKPNAWGLYDMHGNIWEWCQDGYSSDYSTNLITDPKVPDKGEGRVLRGGSWSSKAWDLRSADRGRDLPDLQLKNYGFRVARDI